MEFVLSLISEEQKMLRDTVVKLCRGKLKELDDKVGETNIVNRGILEFLGTQGLLGLTVPGKYGSGPDKMSLVSFCLVREELARTCPNAELILTMQGLGAGPIVVGGNDSQKQKYLLPRLRGRASSHLLSPNPAAERMPPASFRGPSVRGIITG